MTILEAREEIYRVLVPLQRDAFRLGELGQPADDFFLKLCEESEEEIRPALWQFVAEGSLPTMTPRETTMISLRLDQAYGNCDLVLEWLRFAKQPSTDFPREKLLSWLLFDLWQHGGLVSIHGMLEEACPRPPPPSDMHDKN